MSLKARAQEITIEKETSKEINSFAQSIRNIETFYCKEGMPIYIRLFECSSTITNLEGKDVVQYNLYMIVKQATGKNFGGEYGWFWIKGDFINPRNYSFDPKLRILSFNSGTENMPSTTSLSISFEQIKIN
ncbi:MAG: hypothetical protein KDC79_16595 [Cyclobacteriaceae bacterium]|nr:hypothetical protein [Cyclobacteriaceae bacterium]